MRSRFLLFAFLVFQLSVYAQCPQRYLDKVFNIVNVQPNIIYGGNKINIEGTPTWLAADLYEPKDDTAALRPVIFLMHGGGFTNNPPINRRSPDIVELAKDLAKRGYVVISPEYRLSSGAPTEVGIVKIAQTVIIATLDVNDAICYFVNSLNEGNPYRIDTSKLFYGGVSAGAVLTLQGLYVDDTSDLDPFYRSIVDDVAAFDHRDVQDLLNHKYCGAHLLGSISISGALLDTNLVKYKSSDMLLIHGTEDGVIPYGIGRPFESPDLPIMYGSGAIYDKIKRSGTNVTFDSYEGLGHVPFLGDFLNNPADAVLYLLQNGTIFNLPILDSTQRHIARFCYKAIGSPLTDCGAVGVFENIIPGKLDIFPNPSKGIFYIKLPEEIANRKLSVEVQNIIGQVVFSQSYRDDVIKINIQNWGQGMYMIKLSYADGENIQSYTGKILVNK